MQYPESHTFLRITLLDLYDAKVTGISVAWRKRFNEFEGAIA